MILRQTNTATDPPCTGVATALVPVPHERTGICFSFTSISNQQASRRVHLWRKVHMMVEIKVGQPKTGTAILIVDTVNISLSKTTVDGEEDIFKIHIKDITPDCSSYFELTEDEFNTARKKLLAGKPNTVIEIATKQTRP